MKITKKIIPFVLAGFLGMVVTACANPNTSSVGPSSSTSDTPITKQDPTITIGLVEGEQYEVDGFRTPTITITPETLTHTVTYYKGGTSVGSEAPTETGDYTITVTTTETAEYNAGSLSKSFLLRHIPTLTFYYGDDVPLADDHQFRVGEELNIYAKSSVETAVITYTYSDATGATLDAAPEEEGVYFLNASVARTDTIGSATASISFELLPAVVKENPTIKFYWDGTEINTKESHWLTGSYATSSFYVDEFDLSKLTHEVTEGVEYETQYEINEVPVELTDPLTPATYAFKITTSESDTHISVVDWVLFEVKARPQKTVPTITFSYNGETLDFEADGDHWWGEGWANSQHYSDEFDIEKLTYEVSDGLTGIASWTLDEAPIEAPTNPLKPGTYALTVAVEETETTTAASTWLLFIIKDKSAPKISLSYDGTAIDTSSNHWIGEGYGDSQYDAADFDVTKLTYTVTDDIPATVTWKLNDNPIEEPTNPLAPGTYAMTVTVTAGDGHLGASDYVLFVIKEAPAAEVIVPEITFSYKGVAVDTSSNHWLGEGYGDSQYEASEFDLAQDTLTTGTYAMTVTVAATETNSEASNYVLFVIKASTPTTITFYYDGAALDADGNHWWGEGYGDSQFALADFDLSKLIWEVLGTTEIPVVEWTLNEAPIEAPTQDTLTTGTYAVTVTVNGVSNWLLFAII